MTVTFKIEKKKLKNGADIMAIKGELFSTEMVQAFLENRKTRTSRPIKHRFKDVYGVACAHDKWSEAYGNCIPDCLTEWYVKNFAKPKYKPGDIMYVRETWREHSTPGFGYIYKADYIEETTETALKWHPSLHMPHQAARLFFRITDVKMQNITDMTEQNAIDDGFKPFDVFTALAEFNTFWQKQYGPDANWMWVYSLKSIRKEKALKS